MAVVNETPAANPSPAAETAYRALSAAEPPNSVKNDLTHYIDWPFLVYEGPNFTLPPIAGFPPGEVDIIMRGANGWALAAIGDTRGWVYLNGNFRYLEKACYLFEKAFGAEPVSAIAPQIVGVRAQNEQWLQINTWQGPLWVNLALPSPSARLDVPAYNQRTLGYPTGCEIISAAMMIGCNRPFTEDDIHKLVLEMPRSNDPRAGFRGDPSTAKGFTVFPEALLETIESYLDSAEDMTGCTVDDLKYRLDARKPVVVWVVGMGFNVHAVCLTGYDENGLYYNNPWTGEKDAYIPYDDFYVLWNEPIYDGWTGEAYPARKALSY